VNVGGAALLLVLMRRRIGLEHVGRTMGIVSRVVLGAAAAAAAALAVWYSLDEVLGRSFGGQVVAVGAGLAAAGLGYVLMSRALGVRELDTLLLLRGRRRDVPE
jgi:peptidoglycan biosynthesis protein MviN/MurJ (putative lipid II flippase)